MRRAGVGGGLIVGVVALIWLGSGFFIVQEGQQAVVMTFGKFARTVDAGIQWRFPYPFQSHETVPVTQLRSRDVGRNTVVQATGLREPLVSSPKERELATEVETLWQAFVKSAEDVQALTTSNRAAVAAT